MPRIGLRNIKTAIAVSISIAIYLIIILICYIFERDYAVSIKTASQIYTPFFACIATAYSIGTDKSKSLEQAKLRIIASIIGGLFGILVLALYIYGFKQTWPFSYISATGNPTNGFEAINFNFSFIISFIPAIITVGISSIIVVWLCNLLKQKNSSFIAVLTLTAVMSSLGTAPIVYGLNRILSTIIGVLVALGVNLFRLPRFKNKKNLFVISMDGIYLEDNAQVNGFHSYKINQLIYNGANVTYFSTRTPMGLIPMTNDVDLKLPVICLSGAALYDINKREFIYTEMLDKPVAKTIMELLKTLDVNPFINTIRDDVLYTFNENPSNEGEIAYATERKNSANGSYMTLKFPEEMDVCYFVLVQPEKKINEIKEALLKSPIIDDIVFYEYDCYSISEIKATKGYKYFKIYSKAIKELKALEILKDMKYNVVSCGTHKYDVNLFSHSDYSITDIDSPEELKTISSKVIESTSDIKLFKEIDKMYHKKNINN